MGIRAAICGAQRPASARRRADSGDELGQLNDYSYHDDPLKRDDSRYLHRGKFDWDAAARREENPIYTALRDLEALRRTEPVFHADADVWTLEPYNDHILGIGRYYRGQKLLALFNFARTPQTAYLSEQGQFRDLATGETLYVQSVPLEACGYRWLLQG